MKKRFERILAVCALLIVLVNFQVKAQTHSSHPNIIILYADDLGYGDLSCYGATRIRTPHIDKLASEGIRFTNGHCTSATCTPSRFSILTGEYPWRIKGAHILPGDASLIIPLDKATLPSMLKNAGYTTACIGKWHLGLGSKGGPDWNGDIRPGPDEVGFDYAFFFPATADRVPTIYIENHHVVGLDTSDPIQVNYRHKVGDDPTGKEHPELLKMKSSFGHNNTIVNGIGRIGWMSGGKRARWVDEELEDDFTRQAETFIGKNKDHPFFLYFAMSDIHVPRMPDTRFKGKSRLGYRGDAILQMDDAVGQIMKTLDCLGLAKNTIVIFSSDNGPVLDNGYVDGAVEMSHGHQPAGLLRGGKSSIYEGGTRVPLIIRWPGEVKPGTTSDALVSQVDFLASFAGLAHQKLKTDDASDSYDVLSALLGKSGQGRSTYIEQSAFNVLALIKDNWKYIEPHRGPRVIKATNIETGNDPQPQLYNLKKDIGEKNNLAARYPGRVKKMAAALEDIKEGSRTREEK